MPTWCCDEENYWCSDVTWSWARSWQVFFSLTMQKSTLIQLLFCLWDHGSSVLDWVTLMACVYNDSLNLELISWLNFKLWLWSVVARPPVLHLFHVLDSFIWLIWCNITLEWEVDNIIGLFLIESWTISARLAHNLVGKHFDWTSILFVRSW